ncbi:XRE family transcriptional regulator [Asanoa ishikariensis]|uniref:DNA-binding transcriptional activator of the SARP family n=1 Tax=Asanoa ishikariensis TaxID=137265 RepID=A0A1H3TM52_9ACTN|nr:BTAD domain-containing putative transcriptional regulator [Asanoa ishikariensis]GIF62160.1 XRE family transcriptional regulator [Asanoa ishikariensis]SDZ51190.1 DNA-binding transcriptional activator of the SARP family [Asanoa ishikariensis]
MSEDHAAHVGAAIRRHRTAAGLTQQELAQRAGLSVRSLREIEQGRVGRPRSSSVRGLLDALALPADEGAALLSPSTAARRLRVGVLGPLDVVVNGSNVDLQSVRQRTVLALFALHHGRTVPVDDIIDALWGDQPPRTARNLVQLYVGEVRTLLEPAGHTVRFAGSGYAAELGDQEVDLARFDDLETRARAAWSDGDAEQAARLYADALGFWRGPALVDAGDRLRHHPAAIAAGQRRIAATVAFADAAIALGAGERAIPALRAMCREEPLHEAVHGRLMLALAAADERAAALQVFADLRAVLADELGVEPGAALADIHLRILRNGRPVTGAAPPDRPARQLPAPPSPFVGRTGQLAALDQLLTGDLVAVIAGTAGAGKTALAVHWAHRVAEEFPDGQLYLNLRGYDPDTPLNPGDALARLLAGLGVPGETVAATVDERAAQLRTELAGRRVLMLLDNAGTAEQVRPLLPGTAGCAVVVTSRDDLAGLVAERGARRVDLDLLPEAESALLLRRLIGARAEAAPDAVARLARQCAHLPLALRVAAELAAARAESSLADLAGELADHHERLRSLDAGGDPRAAVATVFSWSTRQLAADTARTFRLLGLHPGANIDAYAAAALAGTSPRQARHDLAALGRAHLTQVSDGGRHGMHDLLRAYAMRLSGELDGVRQSVAARGRLLDFYLATAAAAMDTLHPAEAHRRPRVPASPTPMPDLPDAAAALAWLDAERPTLVAVTAHAAAHGFGSHATRLATVLFRYLEGSHFADASIIYRHALAAARHDRDRAAQADALHGLGCFHFKCGHFDLAARYLRTAREHFRHVGDRGGEARALNNLGSVEQWRGRYDAAAELHQRALNRFLDVGDQVGQARALSNLGRTEYRLGRLDAAAGHLRQALALCRTIADAPGEAEALDRLGSVEHQRGHHSRAAEYHLRSLRLHQRNGDRSGEASTMTNLGTVYPELGRHAEAADLLHQAQALYRELGDQDGEGMARNGLGEASRAEGQHAESLRHHTAALALVTMSGARDQQARAHAGLGHAHDALGSAADANLHFRHALALYADLGMPEAEPLRTHVATRRPR